MGEGEDVAEEGDVVIGTEEGDQADGEATHGLGGAGAVEARPAAGEWF